MTHPSNPNTAPSIRPRTLAAILLIVALAALTTIHRLGAADVCGSNEAVEAVFLQQMVEHDALLFPLENGRSPMYKPPLFHWTAVALDRLTGVHKVTAFNLRMPTALYAIAGVILAIAFASAFLGASGGLMAGLILTASYQYIENARIGRVDMTLCFFETLALFAFAWWSAPARIQDEERPFISPMEPKAKLANESASHAKEAGSVAPTPLVKNSDPAPSAPALFLNPLIVQGEGKRVSRAGEGASLRPDPLIDFRRGPGYLRYVLAIALGLAVLAKGPVGALLPGLAIAIFLVAEQRLRDVWRLATPGPVMLTLAIASSWYLACLFGRRYGFLDRQLGSENFGRFFGSLGAMAPWYYLKPLLLNSAPLSLLVPFAAFAALRTYWSRSDLSLRHGAIDPPSDPINEGDGALSQPLSTSRERSPEVGEVNRRAGEGRPPAASSYRTRPSQNPLSLWMSLRMMFLPKMDIPHDPSAPTPDDRAQSRRALIAVRLFAIFWVATVLFFTVAAYKRRAYLLPLWPVSAVMLSWWLSSIACSRHGRLLRPAVVATCAVLIVVNFFYLPHAEVRECAGDSMREAAAQINRVVGPDEPLYLYQFGDEPAPLLFYLNRNAPTIDGKLGDAPPGYVITTAEAWRRLKPQALDLEPVFESSSGRPRLVLLRRGKALALR
jgi:4-amino-4-deoxy-L-arabinose transferase-like glycosyltransferase